MNPVLYTAAVDLMDDAAEIENQLWLKTIALFIVFGFAMQSLGWVPWNYIGYILAAWTLFWKGMAVWWERSGRATYGY